jgi:hypothetical protein
MPSREYRLLPRVGLEIPISLLEVKQREDRLWISTDPIVTAAFPPCIKNVMQKVAAEKGRYRGAAILASFLGQSGWKIEEAKSLWLDAVAVEERIFAEWFGKMHCPKCETMRRKSRGYPDLGIADLGLCQPDEKCRGFVGPVEYAANLAEEKDWCRGSRMLIRTVYQARVFDWTAGKVGEIELSLAEKDELEGLQKEQAEDEMLIYTRKKVGGKLRSMFFQKKIEGPRRRLLSELL